MITPQNKARHIECAYLLYKYVYESSLSASKEAAETRVAEAEAALRRARTDMRQARSKIFQLGQDVGFSLGVIQIVEGRPSKSRIALQAADIEIGYAIMHTEIWAACQKFAESLDEVTNHSACLKTAQDNLKEAETSYKEEATKALSAAEMMMKALTALEDASRERHALNNQRPLTRAQFTRKAEEYYSLPLHLAPDTGWEAILSSIDWNSFNKPRQGETTRQSHFLPENPIAGIDVGGDSLADAIAGISIGAVQEAPQHVFEFLCFAIQPVDHAGVVPDVVLPADMDDELVRPARFPRHVEKGTAVASAFTGVDPVEVAAFMTFINWSGNNLTNRGS